jgi:hypothetical protein
MSVTSGQAITKEFRTRNFTTGVLADADATPTGTLYVNGTPTADVVTVTRQSTGRYDASVTLPALAVGAMVELEVAATVGGVSDAEMVWSDTVDAPAADPTPAPESVLAANAAAPWEVEVEGQGRVRQHSLKDQIEYDRYAASKAAAANGRRGIRITKLIPPGAD